MGWKGESRRHSLSRKGIKTNLPDGRRFDVSNYVARGTHIGIDFQSTFNENDRILIEESVHERIANVVKEGYTSGQLLGEEPNFQGWFEISIEEDENDEEIRNEEVARLIKEGYTSGYYPTWSFKANVWRDE